jgi:methylenetetrahydrofolate dehydrogenase (NADP+)/methenyltetrahydrofolate cyclohydrolase
MSATVIDGRAVSARVRAEVARAVAAMTADGLPAPGLATILVGDDPASAIYVANKRKACAEAGIGDHHRHLPADVGPEEIAAAIDEANGDPAISGILLQLPLPGGIDAASLTARITA